MSSYRNRLTTLAAVTAMALGSLLASTPASAQAPVAATSTTGSKYCYTVVDRPVAGSPETRVISRTCSNTPEGNTKLPKGLSTQAVAAADSTLLVTFFADLDYGGAWDTVGGRAGTCDSTGYAFSDLSLVNYHVNGISSYKLNGNCKRADYWESIWYHGAQRYYAGINNRYVSAPWNDKLLSMKVRS